MNVVNLPHSPLASKIRPQKLSEFIGQKHLVGKDQPLRLAIDNKKLISMVFWGPPGTGKTTLGKIYAQKLKANLFELSAVSAGKNDIKKVVESAKKTELPTILFLDEIHRFNKAQQDFLLPFVETGIITLIGATTENPSFEIISPLLSRCRVFILKELTDQEISQIISRAVAALNQNQKPKLILKKEALEWLILVANGDARQVISIIDNCYHLYHQLSLENLKKTVQSRPIRFDKQGDEHYNLISSFIKCMRASNVDAALYYLARMVESGQDPKFIARRMVVFASEDVASPTALVVANAVFRAVETVGYPECQENLAAGTVYLAQAPKDRRAYDAYMAALADVKQFGNLPIPLNLRNAPTKLMKEIGYSKGYEMYSKAPLLPEKIASKKYFLDKK